MAKKGKAKMKDASSLFTAGFKAPSGKGGKGKGKSKKPSLKKGGPRGRQALLEKA